MSRSWQFYKSPEQLLHCKVTLVIFFWNTNATFQIYNWQMIHSETAFILKFWTVIDMHTEFILSISEWNITDLPLLNFTLLLITLFNLSRSLWILTVRFRSIIALTQYKVICVSNKLTLYSILPIDTENVHQNQGQSCLMKKIFIQYTFQGWHWTVDQHLTDGPLTSCETKIRSITTRNDDPKKTQHGFKWGVNSNLSFLSYKIC